MISAPDDYGLTPQQTLGHTASSETLEGFDAYWHNLREAIGSLPVRWRGSIDGELNEVIIPSLQSVRIVARITMPPRTPRGVVIAIPAHGIATESNSTGDQPPQVADAWTERDLIMLRLAVRGYPPSTIDIDDLGDDWILHRIESADAWIMRGAVADVVQAYRCARSHFGKDMSISLHGESLGGGLAVLAAAQLAAMGDPPTRLIVALPSLGDWRWRNTRYCNGAGAKVNMMVEALRGQQRDDLMRTVLLFDAALHARACNMPVLAKLALQDDTVPAPSAAAVFNALGSQDKWRFVTRFGHFDGGLADARRHALFERIHPAFADADRPAADAVRDHLIEFNL